MTTPTVPDFTSALQDKVLDWIGQIEGMAPQAVELALAGVRLEGLNLLLANSIGALFFAAVAYFGGRFALRLFRTLGEADFADEPPHLIGGIIGGIVSLIALVLLPFCLTEGPLSAKTWAALVAPEVYLANAMIPDGIR